MTVGLTLAGGTGRPWCFRSSTCSSIPQRALYKQSSTECPTPVNPSRSGEKKPKNVGSSVASTTREYFRSITWLLRPQSGSLQYSVASTGWQFFGAMVVDSEQSIDARLGG